MGGDVCVYMFGLTSKDGAEFGPAGDPSFRGELAQCDLQEEHRQTTTEQEDEVRDEKRTCKNEYRSCLFAERQALARSPHPLFLIFLMQQ